MNREFWNTFINANLLLTFACCSMEPYAGHYWVTVPYTWAFIG